MSPCLTRLLSRRFGPLPAWAEQRISKANGDQLDAWFDGLLDAKAISAFRYTDI
ncbi:DUF4351 domain-containing protein [Lamprobacter sp.]|uniref:DUF4351 domain-containing protein n=1 Tax=Lamprobacter sp. TaxID=3100796 RepID=UPI002B25F3E0|nr:DUF4351 domain-containing protein [Lamprobacter sp.]